MRIKIISDGDPFGTIIRDAETDKPLSCVTELTLTFRPTTVDGKIECRASLEIADWQGTHIAEVVEAEIPELAQLRLENSVLRAQVQALEGKVRDDSAR